MTKVVYCGGQADISTKEKIRRILTKLGGLSKIVRPGNTVLIKPNFVAPFFHAVTSFEILEALVQEIRQCGGRPIIGESSGFEFDTETTFNVLGAYEFACRNQVELVNFDNCDFTTVQLQHGLVKEVKIPSMVQEADVLINVPKLKRHSLTKVTIGSKNLFGLLARESRRKIHSLGLERGIWELARTIKSDIVIVDGTVITDRAVYGAQKKLGLIIGGLDVYSVDMFCCQFLNINYRDVGHLRLALEKGPAQEKYKVISIGQKDEEICPSPPATSQQKFLSEILSRFAYQVMYFADILYSLIRRRKSLIPWIHFYFGIRPKLDSDKCTECGMCLSACPVQAIRISQRRIVASLCMPVRCLRCIQACPESAINIRGRGTSYHPSKMYNGKNYDACPTVESK